MPAKRPCGADGTSFSKVCIVASLILQLLRRRSPLVDGEGQVKVVSHAFRDDAVLSDRNKGDAGEPEPRRLAKEL